MSSFYFYQPFKRIQFFVRWFAFRLFIFTSLIAQDLKKSHLLYHCKRVVAIQEKINMESWVAGLLTPLMCRPDFVGCSHSGVWLTMVAHRGSQLLKPIMKKIHLALSFPRFALDRLWTCFRIQKRRCWIYFSMTRDNNISWVFEKKSSPEGGWTYWNQRRMTNFFFPSGTLSEYSFTHILFFTSMSSVSASSIHLIRTPLGSEESHVPVKFTVLSRMCFWSMTIILCHFHTMISSGFTRAAISFGDFPAISSPVPNVMSLLVLRGVYPFVAQ